MTFGSGEHAPDRAGQAASPALSPFRGARSTRLAQTDLIRALLRLADGRAPDATLVRDALRCARSECGAVYGLIKATLHGATVEDDVHVGPHDPAFWREPASRALAQSIALGQSVEIRYRAREQPVRLAVVAAPIGDADGDAIGALALVLEIVEDHDIERARIELRSFAATLWLLLRERPQRPQDGSAGTSELRAAIAASSATSRTGVAIALTNQLRAKLGCDSVAIGMVKRSRARILAISGFADVNARTPGCLAIQGAMEECLDLDRPVAVSAQEGSDDLCPLHRHWSGISEGAFVATVPLRDPTTKRVTAIVALRHAPGKRFQPDELKKIADGMVSYPAALRTAERAHRSLAVHLCDALVEHVLGARHARGALRLFASLGGLCLCAWILFGTMTHTVSARARIAPTLVQQLTAPLDARITAALAREGERVNKGDPLLTFDTSALEIEGARLEALIRAAEIEAEVARTKGDHGLARLVLARCEVDRASLASVKRRIVESTIHAPDDGFILRGDVRDRVGTTVARGATLLEFVPRGGLRLLLDINERDLVHVVSGAVVEFRPHAQPDRALELTLQHVRPAAEVRDAENVFVGEAALDAPEPWMLAGVEGAARVTGERAPVWWVLFHRIIDSTRLRLWM